MSGTDPSPPRVPPVLEAYLAELAARLSATLGRRLLGAYLIGGPALGSFVTETSDADVAVVVDGGVTEDLLSEIVRRCSHEALACPVRKLELVVYPVAQTRRHVARPRWVLNLNTGRGEPLHAGRDPDSEPRHWFVIDLAVAREHGIPLVGPPARGLVGPRDREDLLRALDEGVAWYALNQPGSDTVAAACRAWHFREEGRFSGKAEAIRWACERLSARLLVAERQAGG